MSHNIRRHLACFILLFGFIAFALPTQAQDLDDVTITGRVLDTNNAAIPGAKVTATLEATGATRTVTADAEGRYRLIELKPGTYTLTVIAGGFAENKFANIVTVAGQNVQLDVPLSPQGATVEVEISDDTAPAVDTTRTVVGGTVSQQQIEELPNVSRNPLDLIFTLGGTSEESLSTKDLAEDRNANPRVTPSEQGSFSLSGGASYSNNITIDGLDNNDDRSASDRFQPSLESIAEVQVITNQFSAEYGRASGGRVNLRTRSGTNRFRGRAFMFFRDDNLNANSWYNNSRGIARLPLTEYNPGFTLSGPVTIPFLYKGKNRTFFAVAYEYNKLEDTTLIDSYVPVAGNPRFMLPTSTGGTPTCDNANAATCTATPPTAAFVSPYTFTLPTPNQVHTLTARIDHKLFTNNEATFGFQFGRKANRRTSGASTTRIEDALQVRNNNTNAFNIADNQVFGAKSVNQFRFQWSRYTPSYQTDNPLDPVVLITYRNPILNATQTLIAGNSTASSLQNFADSRKETRYQFQDSLSYLLGGHTLKAGADLQRVNSQAISLSDATGTFNFNSVLNYQNNTLSRYRQNFGTASDVTNTYWGAFINDEFRLRSNFTVSYGVRYEKETAVTDNNNFGPRLGIAWDPFKKGKGVIRFGAGIFYNRVLLRTVGDFIQNSNGGLFQFDTNFIGTGAGDTRRIAVLARIAQQFPNGYASVADVRSAVTSANCAFTGLPAVACAPTVGFSTNTGNSSNPLRTVDPNLKNSRKLSIQHRV